ncbi:beta-glucosidase, partial [Pseudomonas sp. BGM005]|nr:beta-glucosidase [Pseudomonas sp. BG5]
WEQQVQPDYAHASAAAVKAGNDMVMNTPGFFEGALEAVSNGLLAADAFDDAVARILTLKFELGLFENPRLPQDELDPVVGSAAHAQLNLETARRSIVLLENDGVLPLDAAAPLKVAVVGPLADD